MKKPRLLLLMQLPPPVYGSAVSNQYVAQSEHLRRAFDVRVLPLRFARDNADVGRPAFRKLAPLLSVMGRLLGVLVCTRPDLVYMTLAPRGVGFLRDFLLIVMIKAFRVPLCLHLRGQGIQTQSQRPAWRCMYRFAFHRAHVICISPLLRKDIAHVYAGEPQYILNAIRPDPDPLLPRSAAPRHGRSTRFLFLSHVRAGKGIWDFLDALALLHAEGVAVEARIVGAAHEISELSLRAEIERRALSAIVEYRGPRYGTDKRAEWEWADVFVFPTHIDTFGLVMLEAMQHGRPVIAARCGAIPNVISHGHNGLLFAIGDVRALRAAMAQLAHDPHMCEAMGRVAQRTFQQEFQWPRFEQQLVGAFHRFLGTESRSEGGMPSV